MKKILLASAFSISFLFSSAQTFIMSNGSISTCSGTFLDPGGAGNYGNNLNITQTICSSVAGQSVQLTFTSYLVENGDHLRIYDGASIYSPVIGTYYGTVNPGVVTATNGCLTIVFVSDASYGSSGWSAQISCVTNPVNCGCITGIAPANNECATSINLGNIVPPYCDGVYQPSTTAVGTTNCATYSNVTSNCIANVADVWYRFVPSTSLLRIYLQTNMSHPQISLYKGNCNNLNLVSCISGDSILTDTLVSVTVGINYKIKISGGSISDQCDFKLTLWNEDPICNTCVLKDTLIVNPPATNGIYPSGTTVNFCYNISQFQPVNINWLHSVIPVFTGGWDTTSFVPISAPPLCDTNGYWSWYNTNVISTSNGLSYGHGFYFESTLGDPNSSDSCCLDNNPGNNYGQQDELGLCDWTFCWSMKTSSAVPCFQTQNLGLSIYHYGDGTTGSWGNIGCSDDTAYTFFSSVSGPTTCPKPTSPFTTILSNTKAKLNWTTQPCAIAYKVRIRKTGTNAWTNYTIASNIGYKTVIGLTPNTSYQWQVRSICQATPLVQSAFTSLQTFTTPLRMEEVNEPMNEFILYPNPSSNAITISSSAMRGIYELKICNILGQTVSEHEVVFSSDGILKFDVANLSSGYYQLILFNENEIVSKRFVKE